MLVRLSSYGCIQRRWCYDPEALHHHYFHCAQLLNNKEDEEESNHSRCRMRVPSPVRGGSSPHDDDHHRHHENFLQTLCERGQLDMALDALSRMQTLPSTNTYLSLLKACNKSKALTHVKEVHTHLTRHRAELTGFLGDYLVMTLAKCGAISDACQISCTLPHRTVFSWTAIISAYTECSCGQEALEIYQCMQEDGVEPNSYTFVSLFKACGSIPDLVQGKKLHADARSRGLTSNVFVGNTLVSMYGKCGALVEAEEVFSALPKGDVVSWNAMLSAYVEQDHGEKALLLYRQMQEEGISSNQQTLISALQACGTLVEKAEALERPMKLMSLEIGQALHAIARRRDYTSDAFVGTALLHMYGNCGAFVEAEDVFSALSYRDIISWTALLSAYLESGQGEKALQLYGLMHEEGMSPNQLTFGIVLQACRIPSEGEETLSPNGLSAKSSLEIGQALHVDARKKGYTSDLIVGNPLISMYGKFHGTILEAEDVFGALLQRNIVTWNVMLSAYVEQGEVEKALQLYQQMQTENVSLNDFTLIAILQACSETGSLNICEQLHFGIVSTGQISSVIATVIHAYGSCASMADAQAVFDQLLEPQIVSWNACIAGHAGEGNYEASMHMLERLKLAGIKPDEITLTSILSACSHTGLVVKGYEYFDFMSRDYGLTPDVKHYGIMVDLLGRAGDFRSVESMLERMPMPIGLTIWLCLLGACRIHGNLVLAKQAFNYLVHLQPKQASAYVLMSNIYADAGLEDCTAESENSRHREGM